MMERELDHVSDLSEKFVDEPVADNISPIEKQFLSLLTDGLAVENFNLESITKVSTKPPDKLRLRSLLLEGRDKLLQGIGITNKVASTKTKKVEEESVDEQSGGIGITKKHTINKARRGRNKNLQERLEVLEVKKKVWNENIRQVLARKMAQKQGKENLNAAKVRMGERESRERAFREESYVRDGHQRVADTRNERTGHRYPDVNVRDQGHQGYPSGRSREGVSRDRNRFHMEARQRVYAGIKQEQYSLEEGEITDFHHHDSGQVERNWEHNDEHRDQDRRIWNRNMQDRVMRTYVDDADRPERNERETPGCRWTENQNRPGSSGGRREQNSPERVGRTLSSEREKSRRHGNSFQEDRGFHRNRSQFIPHTATSSRNNEYENVSVEEDDRDQVEGESEQNPSHWAGSMRGARNWRGKGRPQFRPNEQMARRGKSWKNCRQFHGEESTSRPQYQRERNHDRDYWTNSNEDRSGSPNQRRQWSGDRERGSGWKPPAIPLPFDEENWEDDTMDETKEKEPETQTRSKVDQHLAGNSNKTVEENRNEPPGLPSASANNTKTGPIVNQERPSSAQDTDISDGIMIVDSWSPGDDSSDEKESTNDTTEVRASAPSPADKGAEEDTTKRDSVTNDATNVSHATKKRPRSTSEECPSKRKKDDTLSESQRNPHSCSDIMGKANKDAKEAPVRPGSSNLLPSTTSPPLSKEGKTVDATSAESTPNVNNSENDENERTDYPVLSIPEPTEATKTSVVTISTTSILNTTSSTAVASNQVQMTSDKGLTSAVNDTINSTVVTIPGLNEEATVDSDPKTPVSTTASTAILPTITSTIEASNDKTTNETTEYLSASVLSEAVLEVGSVAFTATVTDTTTASRVSRDSDSVPPVPLCLTDITLASHGHETTTNNETLTEEIRISIRSDIFEENSDDDSPPTIAPGVSNPSTTTSLSPAQILLENENAFLEFLGCSTQVSNPAVTIANIIATMTTTQSSSTYTASTVQSQTVPVTTVTNAGVANELRPPSIPNSHPVVMQPDLSKVTATATSSQSSTPGSTGSNSTNRANPPPRNIVNLQDVMRTVIKKIIEKKVDFDAKIDYYDRLFSNPEPITMTIEEQIDCVNFFRADFFTMFEILDASLISVNMTNTAPLFDDEAATKNLDPPIEVLTDYYSVLIESIIFSRYCHTETIKRILHVIVFRIMRLLHYFMVHVNPVQAETKFQNVCAMLLKKESLQHLTKSPTGNLPKLITQLWDNIRATGGRKYFYQGAIIDYKHCQPEMFQRRIDKFKESYYRWQKNAITDGTGTSTSAQQGSQTTTQTYQVAQQPKVTIQTQTQSQTAIPPSGSNTQTTQPQPSYAYPRTLSEALTSPQFQSQNVPQQRTQATPCQTMSQQQNQSQRLPNNQQTSSQPNQTQQNLQRTSQVVPYTQQTVVSPTQNNSAQSHTQLQEQLSLQRLLQTNPQTQSTPQVTMQQVNQRLVRRLSGPQSQTSQALVQQRQVQLSQSSAVVSSNLQRQHQHYRNELAKTKAQLLLTQQQHQQQLQQRRQRTALVQQQSQQQQQLQQSHQQQQQLQESQRQQQLRQAQLQQLQESQRQQQLRQQMQQSQPQPAATNNIITQNLANNYQNPNSTNVRAPNQHMTQSSRATSNPDDEIQFIGYGTASREQVGQVSAPASSPPTIRVHYGGVQIAQTPFHTAATVTTEPSSLSNFTLSSGSGAQSTNLVPPNNTLVQSGLPVHNPNNEAQFQQVQSNQTAMGYTGINVEAVGGGQEMSTILSSLVPGGDQVLTLFDLRGSDTVRSMGYSTPPTAGPSFSQVMQPTPNALPLSNVDRITNSPIRQLTQQEINERTNTVYLPDGNGNVSLSFQTTEEALAHLYGRNNI